MSEAISKVESLKQEVNNFPQQFADAKELVIADFKKSSFLSEDLALFHSHGMEIGQTESINVYAKVEHLRNKEDL